VNGVPSCANDWLLGTLLRDAWSFDGAVVSDCDADSDVFNSHHYTQTPQLAVQAVLRAGTDVDCGGFVTQYAQSAINGGQITEADLDTVLVRQFKLRIRLGHFDPPGPLQTIGPDQICDPYSVEVARDGARQGMVMLKNLGKRLPLGSPATYRNTVVIGPNEGFNDVTYYYGGTPCFHNATTPL
jgi:beta-D-xylosidase 4